MGDYRTSKERERAGNMPWRIVVCGSMSAYGEMLRLRKLLSRSNVPAVIPVAEDNVRDSLTDDEFVLFKRRVAYRHLRKIRHPSTFGILAVNRDKLGVRDYIGPNTFAEIAVAFAQSKRIYLYQDVPKVYEDELHAWGAVSLRGNLSRLIGDLNGFRTQQEAQLLLFG
ncbi:MAG: hypothetical protein LLG20_11090 [Acidobacteriales bacterium]|nr:hypothetical protein [Terriglobales bacterium]